jgi:hypothetical protein
MIICTPTCQENYRYLKLLLFIYIFHRMGLMMMCISYMSNYYLCGFLEIIKRYAIITYSELER